MSFLSKIASFFGFGNQSNSNAQGAEKNSSDQKSGGRNNFQGKNGKNRKNGRGANDQGKSGNFGRGRGVNSRGTGSKNGNQGRNGRGKGTQKSTASQFVPVSPLVTKSEKVAEMGDWQKPVLADSERREEEKYFQDFELHPRILRAILEHMKFRCCSPIQAEALPHVLAGEDIEGKAQTGTGKTATFLIGVLQQYLTDKESGKDDRDLWQPMSFVLAPTRELALQIANDAEELSHFCPEFKTVAVFGGMDYDKQMTALARGVDLVVATPGRLIDYLRKHAVDLTKVKVAVIDEADRMLDMGFIPDVKRIFSHLNAPEQRQTMLYSATLTHDIEMLARIWMRKEPVPTVIEIEPEHILAEGINETIYAVTTSEKMAVLLWTLQHEDCRRVIIFRNRKHDVESLAELLKRCGVPCEMLSGDVEQKKRLRILDDFRSGKVKIVVATDVAGRGIHVDGVTHVINYDLPYEAEDYVHRVGRTARAGHKGRAISFADEDGSFVVPDIEKFIERSLPITQPEEEMLVVPENLQEILRRAPRESHNGSMRAHSDYSGSHYSSGVGRGRRGYRR